MIKDAIANHIPRDETVDGECVAPTGMNRGEAAIELLRTGVASKTITADAAAEQLAKLLDLPASRRIQIRETVKATFETGDDVISKIRPYLKRSTQVAEQHARKTIAVTSDV